MEKRMTESELLGNFREAIENEYIFVVYQPQINHSTGRMIGAEALVRWKDPENGMQFPSDFIPVLENNGLIFDTDIHVFEMVCKFQRKCLDEGMGLIPISVNMSRFDIYDHNYVEQIEEIRKKYDIPVKYLRIEITESSAIGGIELVSDVLDKLHELGYLVEMDDFGSGYSSLNILKDLDVDIIKLDMTFLSGNIGGRGGTILSSMVNMARWLKTPVIAEGVETMTQADYMNSIGCNYIQGYLYYKPLREEEFIKEISVLNHEPTVSDMSLIDTIEAGKFWNPESMETLIFSNYVGAAAVFSYDSRDESVEVLRVNKKYIKEVGMGRSEKEIISSDPWENQDEKDRKLFMDTVKKAIESGEEEVCEHWRTVCTEMCGVEKICVRSSIRIIGRTENRYLFYTMVRNITAEKKQYNELYNSERRFRFASEQANVYAWEYDIATKRMRPCYRCMRDLGLPPLLENYPEPAIDAGIFPQDYADMYRGWHKKLEEGVDHLEAIIPLTIGRVPFHVRYTTEFDENGKPLKAYGSATMVVEDEENPEGNPEENPEN